jgi:hypothetical protein
LAFGKIRFVPGVSFRGMDLQSVQLKVCRLACLPARRETATALERLKR